MTDPCSVGDGARLTQIKKLADELVALAKSNNSAASSMTAMMMAAAALCVEVDERAKRHDSSELFMKQLYGFVGLIKKSRASSEHARSRP